MSRFESKHACCGIFSAAELIAGHPAPRPELGAVFYSNGRAAVACDACGRAVEAKSVARASRAEFDRLNAAIAAS
jgi:hypothetical protein